MSAHSFLDQLLKTGAGVFADAQAATGRARASGDLQKYASGAAVGGVLALLLGTRRGRSLGGSALKLGSVAAIGALAWKAYQDYQAGQRGAAAGTANAGAAPRFEALPEPELEQHSRAMLKAMIAAAKSDGHMDDRERELVHVELTRTGADAATQTWVEAELKRPIDPAEVAAAATTPEMAAEVYLASLLMADETTTMERAYLDELARQLNLAPGLKSDLEARAQAQRG
ncbi:MAG: tellurite resistance TerB family protein [Betaproteobacteria bacterium]|nr:tellurite resistance TerB family protein [Betaproteobacteria bacterium]